jgi:prepilin-type N-terminal cleavage/methylation domain-containing protein/prepilin-type processing-associated H-X9-DG protein
MPTRQKKEFTLIELLVVIAIIAILASLLLPTLGKAKDTVKAIVCTNNLKQQYLSTHLYLTDYNGYYPNFEEVGGWGNCYLQSFWPYRLLLMHKTLKLDTLICNVAPTGNSYDPAWGAWKLGITPSIMTLPTGTFVRVNYGFNDAVVNSKQPGYQPYSGSYASPSNTFLLGDASYFNIHSAQIGRITESGYNGTYIDNMHVKGLARHGSGLTSNISFMDGHVKPLTAEEVKNDLIMLPNNNNYY